MRFYVIGTDPHNPERRKLHQLIKNGHSMVFGDLNHPKPKPEEFQEDVMRLATLFNVKKLKR